MKWSREIDEEVGYKIDRRRPRLRPADELRRARSRASITTTGWRTIHRCLGEGGLQVKNPATGVPVGESPRRGAGGYRRRRLDRSRRGQRHRARISCSTTSTTARSRKSALRPASPSTATATPAARWGLTPRTIATTATLGIAIGNFANEMTALYVVAEPQPLTFTDEAISRRRRPGQPAAS